MPKPETVILPVFMLSGLVLSPENVLIVFVCSFAGLAYIVFSALPALRYFAAAANGHILDGIGTQNETDTQTAPYVSSKPS